MANQSNERSKAQHTSAPWEIGRADHGEDAAMVYCAAKSDPNDGVRVADCNTNMFLSKEQSLINARLIAAAPELLEALIEASNIFDNYPHLATELQGTFEVVQKAITKARGE